MVGVEGDSTAAGPNASAWKPVEAGAPPQQDSTMLPHAIARRKEQAPPPHMAAWLPQGFMPGLLHAHMESLLGFRRRDYLPFQWPAAEAH